MTIQLRKFRLYFALSFICLGLGLSPKPVQAESYIEPIVYTDYLPIPTYTNAKCTKPTGDKLSTEIDTWRYLKINKKNNAYQLGPKQWVKSQDVYTYLSPAIDEMAYRLTKRKVPIYDSPLQKHRVGYLKKGVKKWQVTQVTNSRVDLGHNQWVANNDLVIVNDPSYFKPGTKTYDKKGKLTGTLAKTEVSYQIVNVQKRHGKVFARIGTNQQWVNYTAQQQNY